MLISPNRNGTVQYGSISTHILGPVHCGGGGGAGSHSFACWSALEVILFSQSFHFLLDPEYRVSTANHKRCSVSAGMWFGQLYFLPVKGVCRTLILFQRMILVNLKPNPNKTHIYISGRRLSLCITFRLSRNCIHCHIEQWYFQFIGQRTQSQKWDLEWPIIGPYA